jgi:hypothetical protein
MGNLYEDYYYYGRYYENNGENHRRYYEGNGENRHLPTASFGSTSFFRPARANHYGYRVIDVRHGRVLLRREPSSETTRPVED